MANLFENIPLSLYIHLPWCVKKCPYCDFNSHEIKENFPEDLYIAALLDELDMHLPLIANRSLTSIFFGGGTPSVFSGSGIEKILAGVRSRIDCTGIEITLEANPGTVDAGRFCAYRAAGVNRLSLGVQSFNDVKLKSLGRIHDRSAVSESLQIIKDAKFDNFNIDIMYGLPNQSLAEALDDLYAACDAKPKHLSWYQLTLEPNTAFAHSPPTLPSEDLLWDIQVAGQQILHDYGYLQYEVSAYAKKNFQCQHNLNYWEFGDYLGIGAGAHSKISHANEIIRIQQTKHPKDYLLKEKRSQPTIKRVASKELVFEFMLNALRLTDGFEKELFVARTGLNIEKVKPILQVAYSKKLLIVDNSSIQLSELGKRYLNDVVGLFL